VRKAAARLESTREFGQSRGDSVGGTTSRRAVKHALAQFASHRLASGLTILTYHRVGGGSPDERDLGVDAFAAQLDVLVGHNVVTLDEGVDRLRVGDKRPTVALTFDDGFADVYDNAWPLLRAQRVPFTLYLASAYVGAQMHWEGSTARADGPALSWDQIREMVESGLCTVGNHSHSHVRPEELTAFELDACSAAAQTHLGVTPQHFAYPWGIRVPRLEYELSRRFRTAVTGEVGRNLSGQNFMRLRRVPVRNTDPLPYFRAKLTGRLGPERAYDALVVTAKRAGVRA
jgi:peptidoglycan/xylan/chitin deacetylase (PgdA/CDA1 family)